MSLQGKTIKYDTISLILLLTVFYSMVIPGILWWLGLSIHSYYFPCAFVLAALSLCRDFKIPFYETIISFLLIGASILINCWIMDISWDGQAYHQPMVYALANGWNPIYESHNTIISELWDMNIWIDHYLKGIETSEATIFAMTGNLESSKAISTIFMLSSILMSWHILNNSKPFNISILKISLYSIIIGTPIIFIHFGFTFYIDIFTYYFVLWIIILIVYFDITRSKYNLFLMASVLYMACATKWNTLFWVCFCIAIYGGFLLYVKRHKELVPISTMCLTTIIIATVTISYNPIITNTIDHSIPVYPMGTEQANDIDKNASPKLLKNKNRFSQVMISLLSRPNDNSETPYLNPFKISYRYNIRSLGASSKLGGAGLFFIEIVILSIFLFIITKNNKYKKLIGIGMILIFISLFILPMGSNYRYVPYISLLPLISLLYNEYAGSNYSWNNIIKNMCLILVCCNLFVAIVFCSYNTIKASTSQQYAIEKIKNTSNKHPYHSRNWSFNYKINGNIIKDADIFSNQNDEYEPIPHQFCQPIFLNKDI